MDTAGMASYWNRQAERFDDEADHGLTDPAVRAAWLELFTATLPATPAEVADLGCGTGTPSVLLAQQGYLVHGLDLSDRMIELADRKARGADPHPAFTVGDAAMPALEPGAFDVVLSRHVLWAMPDPASAIRRWLELLKPGGTTRAGGSPLGDRRRSSRRRRRCARGATRLRRRGPPAHRQNLWAKEIVDERYLLVAHR